MGLKHAIDRISDKQISNNLQFYKDNQVQTKACEFCLNESCRFLCLKYQKDGRGNRFRHNTASRSWSL